MPALLQALPKSGDKQANLGTIDRYASVAAATGAEFVCFPELFLTGYNLGAALRDLAEPVDGPSVCQMTYIARRHGVGLIVGMPERDGDRVFNSAVAVDRGGPPCRSLPQAPAVRDGRAGNFYPRRVPDDRDDGTAAYRPDHLL